MKKTLSLILAMLMLVSVFTVTSFAALAPEVTEITSTFEGISITWEKSADATTYLVYRDGICIGTTVECNFVDTAVVENQTYNYSIGAQSKDGTLEKSESTFDATYVRPGCAHETFEYVVDYAATVFKPGLQHKHCTICGYNDKGEVIAQLVPESPVIFYLSNGVNGVKVEWNAVDGATAYNVYRRTAGSSKWEGPFVVENSYFEDTTAKSGVYYKYAVRAVNAAGLSPYNGGKVIKRVATPGNLYAGNTAGGIFVKWGKVENATAYRVYRKVAGDETWTYLKTVTNNYYPDLAVESGVDYIYTVRALSGRVFSNFLPGVAIRRLDVPTLNEVKSAEEGIYIDFVQVEGATGYNVYRKVNGAWNAQSYLGTIRSPKSHTYLDISAEKGVTYTYTVKAYFKDGTTTCVSAYDSKGLSCNDVY